MDDECLFFQSFITKMTGFQRNNASTECLSDFLKGENTYIIDVDGA